MKSLIAIALVTMSLQTFAQIRGGGLSGSPLGGLSKPVSEGDACRSKGGLWCMQTPPAPGDPAAECVFNATAATFTATGCSTTQMGTGSVMSQCNWAGAGPFCYYIVTP